MTINFYHAVNLDGLFNVLGKAFHAQATLNTARGATVPAEIDDVQDTILKLTPTPEISEVYGAAAGASDDMKSAAGGIATTMRTFARNYLIEVADADDPLAKKRLREALVELIEQMEANSESVDASTVGESVAAGGSNTGDGRIVCTVTRGDGLAQENALGESIVAKAAGNGRTVAHRFTSDPAAGLLDALWPLGSGISRTVSSVDASGSLLANGDFEDEDDVTNLPDDWSCPVGTIGTTIKMTDVEVQTLTVTGTPTAGHYLFNISHDGVTKTTLPIAYNASGATLQAAIRTLPGFESVTVASTGTAPDYTHTITFTGVGGNLAQHTITNNSTGGTYTPATTTAGTAQVFHGGKALHLDSDGAELTTIQQAVTLQPETAYAVSGWAITDSAPAAGVITIDLVDGTSGTVLQDKQGNNASFTLDPTSLTTSWQHIEAVAGSEVVLRTPTVMPDLVYFRIRISTAISNTSSVFLDHFALAAMSELYDGGPLVAVFTGDADWKVDDLHTLTITNDRAGLVQEWANRNFDMAGLGLLLPSNSAGAETIPDSVVG